MTITELVERAHAMSRAKGWYDGEAANKNIGEMLALIHSEVSEALEDWRNGNMELKFLRCCDLARYGHRDGCPGKETGVGKPVGFPSEIADIAIRVGDLCGFLGIDLEKAVSEKMAYNATRPYRHGNKRA